MKDLYLAYGTDEKMSAAIWQEWSYDPNNPYDNQHPTWPWPNDNQFDPDPNDPNQADAVSDAVEFRYESGRRRYLMRWWDPHDRTSTAYWTAADAFWTDYVGDEPYMDFTTANDGSGYPVVTDHVRWLGGLGIRAREAVAEGDPPTRFLHPDLTGSILAETGPTGEVESSGGWEDSLIWQYTAFGEPIFPWPDEQRATEAGRYKYDGLYGYEARPLHMWGANINLPPIQLLHVGERWYQPGIGRFVQRDLIGTLAELNSYLYSGAEPAARIDPSGLWGIEPGPGYDKWAEMTIEHGTAGQIAAVDLALAALPVIVCVACLDGCQVKPYGLRPIDDMRGPEWGKPSIWPREPVVDPPRWGPNPFPWEWYRPHYN